MKNFTSSVDWNAYIPEGFEEIDSEILIIAIGKDSADSAQKAGIKCISVDSDIKWSNSFDLELTPLSPILPSISSFIVGKRVMVIEDSSKKMTSELKTLSKAISHQLFVKSVKFITIPESDSGCTSLKQWIDISGAQAVLDYADQNVKGFEKPGIRMTIPYCENGDDGYLNYLIPYEVKSKPIMPNILIEKMGDEGIEVKPTNAPYIWLKRNLLVLKKGQDGDYSTNDSDSPSEVLSEAEGVTDDRRNVVARFKASDLSEKEGISQFGISGSPSEFLKIARAQRNARRVPTIMVASEKGWLKVDGKLHYLYGSTAITPKGEKEVMPNLTNDREGVKSAGPHGDKEKWETVIKQLIKTNPFQAVVMGFATASAGLDFIGDAEPGVLHVYGDSSAGKTTTLQIAASLIGRGTNPRDTSSWIRGWRTTDNGLEKPLADTNHAPLMLDEIHAAPARTDWQATAYMIANGRGKERMKHTTEARQTSTWCLNVLSSGEVSMSEKIRGSTKGQVPGGLAFRVIDLYAGNIKIVDLNDGNKSEWSEIFGKSIENNSDLAESLENTFSTHYGHFWPELIEWLRDTGGEDYNEMYEHYRNVSAQSLPEDASNIAKRRTKHVASAMAGLNSMVRLLGMEDTEDGMNTLKNALSWAIDNMLTAGIENVSGTEAEGMRESIHSEIMSQIGRFHIEGRTQNPGFNGSLGWVDAYGDLYMPIKTGWNQICANAGLDAERAKDAFKDERWIKSRKRHPSSGSGSSPITCLKAPGMFKNIDTEFLETN